MKVTGSIKYDGDDSSDEEFIETTKNKYKPKYKIIEEPTYIKEHDPEGLSLIAHSVSIEKFYSQEVKGKYYHYLKKENDKYNNKIFKEKTAANKQDILLWLDQALQQSLADVFNIETQPAASKTLLEKFKESVGENLKNKIKIFGNEGKRRLLFRALESEDGDISFFEDEDTGSELIVNSIEDDGFIATNSGEIVDSINDSPLFETSEMTKLVDDYVENFLIKIKFFNKKIGKFFPEKSRPKMINSTINSIEIDNVGKSILEIINKKKPNGQAGFKPTFDEIEFSNIFKEILKEEKDFVQKRGNTEEVKRKFGFRFKPNLMKKDLKKTYFKKLFNNEELYKKYLPYTVNSLIDEVATKAREEWDSILLKNLKRKKVELKIRLLRGLPEQQYPVSSADFDDFLANIRLVMRFQKRRIRQIKEDNEINKDEFHGEIYSVAWKYNDIKYNGIDLAALETQEITSNYARSDIVPNLDSYPKIWELLIKRYELKSKEIAEYVLNLLKGQKLRELDDKISVKKAIVNLTYLLFGLEVQRNPSSLVLHLMMLDLIANRFEGSDKKKCTFGYFFSHKDKVNLYGGGYMPMSMGKYENEENDNKKTSSHAVQCARTLAGHYGIFAIKPWIYKGESAGENTKVVDEVHELLSRENYVVKKWFEMKKFKFKGKDKKQLAEKIREVIKLVGPS